jgi:proteasome lid subunit RPN8/RPN11
VKPSRLVISPEQRRQILEEARRAYPRECCGLVEGVRDGSEIRITALHPMTNLSEELDRFELDPAAHVALARALRGTERRIVGCYHSHPKGRAEPSSRDRAGAFDDGFLWLIAVIDARGEGELRAFLAEHGDFAGLEIVEPVL